MKTPIQEFIDWLNDYPTEVPTIHKSAVMYKAKSMLEKEKEVMCEIYNDAVAAIDPFFDPFYIDKKDYGEKYYNETFNTK